MWLVHKDGFSAARLLRVPPGSGSGSGSGGGTESEVSASGRVRIRLQDTGETIEVDEDDIEKVRTLGTRDRGSGSVDWEYGDWRCIRVYLMECYGGGQMTFGKN